MKRYLLFAGDYYYPCGGMNDFIKSFDTANDAFEHALSLKVDWCHMLDSQTGSFVDTPSI
jgi:hypothetical protein